MLDHHLGRFAEELVAIAGDLRVRQDRLVERWIPRASLDASPRMSGSYDAGSSTNEPLRFEAIAFRRSLRFAVPQ